MMPNLNSNRQGSGLKQSVLVFPLQISQSCLSGLQEDSQLVLFSLPKQAQSPLGVEGKVLLCEYSLLHSLNAATHYPQKSNMQSKQPQLSGWWLNLSALLARWGCHFLGSRAWEYTHTATHGCLTPHHAKEIKIQLLPLPF